MHSISFARMMWFGRLRSRSDQRVIGSHSMDPQTNMRGWKWEERHDRRLRSACNKLYTQPREPKTILLLEVMLRLVKVIT